MTEKDYIQLTRELLEQFEHNSTKENYLEIIRLQVELQDKIDEIKSIEKKKELQKIYDDQVGIIQDVFQQDPQKIKEIRLSLVNANKGYTSDYDELLAPPDFSAFCSEDFFQTGTPTPPKDKKFIGPIEKPLPYEQIGEFNLKEMIKYTIDIHIKIHEETSSSKSKGVETRFTRNSTFRVIYQKKAEFIEVNDYSFEKITHKNEIFHTSQTVSNELSVQKSTFEQSLVLNFLDKRLSNNKEDLSFSDQLTFHKQKRYSMSECKITLV